MIIIKKRIKTNKKYAFLVVFKLNDIIELEEV